MTNYDLMNAIGGFRIVQGGGRDIHRHRNEPARSQPGCQVATHLIQHLPGQGGHQAGLFGQGNEMSGREQPELGMLPARQRFGAAQLMIAQRHLGLVQGE